MKDRYGLTFEELTKIQAEHLHRWSQLLHGASPFAEVREYVLKHNVEAASEEHTHQVWRGQCLFTIFWSWPNIPAPYPSPSATDADLI